MSKDKRVVIVGAGFTGLAAAWELKKKGWKVIIVEADKKAGGLAAGFKKSNWDWSLEYFYHHLFASDKDILKLIDDLGLRQNLIFKRPVTAIWVKGQQIKFDSVIDVLNYRYLSLLDKLHLGAGLGFLKLWPWGVKLEKWEAYKALKVLLGGKGYTEVFEPLLEAKFGKWAKTVNLAWFWARIKARTAKLGYYKGGFGQMADDIVEKLQAKGVVCKLDEKVVGLAKDQKGLKVKSKKQEYRADKVIITTPPYQWQEWLPGLKKFYQKHFKTKRFLGAQTLVLRLKKPFLGHTYWLNINQKNYPFLIVAEHTNFMDKKHYGNEHLVYVGNYLSINQPEWQESKEELMIKFWPFLTKINHDLKKADVIGVEKFQAAFAQPVVGVNYSKQIPPFATGVKGVYVANMFQVYPWDRGINYAVRLGKKVVSLI